MHVVAGILVDDRDRVLISERLCDGPFNGMWEFPGGKVVAGEAPPDALCRELQEELGIAVVASEFFMAFSHCYADRAVDLEFFRVSKWGGTPRGLEGQRLRWVPLAELDAAILLPADKPVVDRLQQILN